MKFSTIETLLDQKLITLEECDESEKETNENVVKSSANKYYKVKETEPEIKMDLLVRIATDIRTMRNIILFCFILALLATIISIALFYH